MSEFVSAATEADFAGGYYRIALVQGDTPGTLTDWLFTGDAGRYHAQDGVLVAVAANEPRINSDGLLIERQNTNLILYSSDRTNGNWAAVNATIAANATNAPDGTATADTLRETVTNTTHLHLQTGPCIAATTYTYSEYVKAAGRTKFRLLENAGSGEAVTFDLVAKTASGVGSIEELADGWFRCSMPFRTGAAQTVWNCQLRLRNNDGTETYAGDGTSGVHVWGAQVEKGGVASSLIQTTNVIGSPGRSKLPAMPLETRIAVRS